MQNSFAKTHHVESLLLLVFCAAGASKLRNSGLEWIASGHLAILLVGKALAGDRIDPPLVWVAFRLWTRPIL